ncbi:MAG: thioredoxin family protein [Limisphaerales bacterium]
MALTPSSMLPLGTPAPNFALPDAAGRTVQLADFAAAPVLVVAFICNHCPFVKHLRAALADFGRECAARGVALVAINCNDAERYPADSPAAMAAEAHAAGYDFPYLFDESQAVAAAYRAAFTPDFFVFDAARRLAYRGQFDDSRPGNGRPVTGADLRAAVGALLAGRTVPAAQTPSMGCNIKWRPGNEPEHAR